MHLKPRHTKRHSLPRVKGCLHVTLKWTSLSQCPSKFNIVSLLTMPLTSRMGMGCLRCVYSYWCCHHHCAHQRLASCLWQLASQQDDGHCDDDTTTTCKPAFNPDGDGYVTCKLILNETKIQGDPTRIVAMETNILPYSPCRPSIVSHPPAANKRTRVPLIAFAG